MTTQAPGAPDIDARPLPIISHWIDGRPVEVLPEQTGPVFNPASGEVIARVPRGGQAEVDAAVAVGQGGLSGLARQPLIARSQIFFAYRELVYHHREELAALITRDHGKTFPDALAEVMRGLETVEFACGLPAQLAGHEHAQRVDERRRTHAAPAPRRGGRPSRRSTSRSWSRCGSTRSRSCAATRSSEAVLPHARRHPAPGRAVERGRVAGRRVQRRVRRPRGGEAMLVHPDIKAIQFVGSTEVGRYVYEVGRGNGKRVGAYTSAKNAMIVLPDADMELAADAAVAAGYGSAGERCMAQTMVIAVGDPRIGSGRSWNSGSRSSGSAPGWSPAWTWARSTRPSTGPRSSSGSQRGGGRRRARRRRPRVPRCGAPRRVLPGREPVRQRDAGHEGLPGGDLRARPRARPRRDVRGGARADQWPSVRQRDRDLHDRRRCRAPVQARRRCPDDRRQRADPGPRRVPLVLRDEGSALGDLAMRGEDGIRFFTQQKMVTERWPEPGAAPRSASSSRATARRQAGVIHDERRPDDEGAATVNPLDTFRLDGRVAFVSGGGGAIGSAIALALAGACARVIVADISQDGAEAAAGASGRPAGSAWRWRRT